MPRPRFSLFVGMLLLLIVSPNPAPAQPAATPAVSPTPSPTPFAVPTNGMILLNLVPKSAPIICRLGTAKVLMDGTGADPILPGLSTGLIPWLPANASLRAEGQGYAPAELRPFLKTGETPVVLLTEKSPGNLSFQVVPNTTEREGGFYDAINLTPQAILEVKINGKPVSLPKGKRTRVGTEKVLAYNLPEGGGATLDSEDDQPHSLLIFYRAFTGKTKCMAVPDIPFN